jgi:hypothetical protein
MRWPRLPPLFGQLSGRLYRWFIRRGTPAEVVERSDPRALLHPVKDPLKVLALERLPVQQFHNQLVQDVPIGVEDLPRLGVRRLDERPHLLVDLVRNLQ